MKEEPTQKLAENKNNIFIIVSAITIFIVVILIILLMRVNIINNSNLNAPSSSSNKGVNEIKKYSVKKWNNTKYNLEKPIVVDYEENEHCYHLKEQTNVATLNNDSTLVRLDFQSHDYHDFYSYFVIDKNGNVFSIGEVLETECLAANVTRMIIF